MVFFQQESKETFLFNLVKNSILFKKKYGYFRTNNKTNKKNTYFYKDIWRYLYREQNKHECQTNHIIYIVFI